MTIAELAPGQSGVIAAYRGADAEERHLLDMGLTPRTRVTMQKIAPMGDPVEIRVRGYELTLRVEDARKIELKGAADE